MSHCNKNPASFMWPNLISKSEKAHYCNRSRHYIDFSRDAACYVQLYTLNTALVKFLTTLIAPMSVCKSNNSSSNRPQHHFGVT